jgi:hypothetical protein
MAQVNPLIGVWKITVFQVEIEGSSERHNIYDDHPTGYLIITAEGCMMPLLTADERRADASPDVLFSTMNGYSGRYRLQGEDTFVTKVDTAWHPAWLGSEQVRHFKLDGNILSIISPPQDYPKFPGKRVRGIAVWEREGPAL